MKNCENMYFVKYIESPLLEHPLSPRSPWTLSYLGCRQEFETPLSLNPKPTGESTSPLFSSIRWCHRFGKWPRKRSMAPPQVIIMGRPPSPAPCWVVFTPSKSRLRVLNGIDIITPSILNMMIWNYTGVFLTIFLLITLHHFDIFDRRIWRYTRIENSPTYGPLNPLKKIYALYILKKNTSLIINIPRKSLPQYELYF